MVSKIPKTANIDYIAPCADDACNFNTHGKHTTVVKNQPYATSAYYIENAYRRNDLPVIPNDVTSYWKRKSSRLRKRARVDLVSITYQG